ncbi:MAG: sugar ABC transporter permease [Caldilineaceae bacterium]|nr:sugar ABC transporter permease [Caldilineaceae bacterium]
MTNAQSAITARQLNSYSWWSRHQRKVIPYLFIAPLMLIFLVFVFFPIFYAAAMSFFEWNGIGTPEFVRFQNYTNLVTDPIFWTAFKNTVIYSAGVVPVSMALGLLAAIGLNRKDLPGRPIFRTIFFLPFVISAVATATTAGWIFGDTFGVINKMLEAVGLEKVRWLSSRNTALLTVMIATVWVRIGFCMLIYLAGLQSIPNDLVEAASIDGATPRQRFRHITLPLLRPTTFLLLVLSIIFSFEVFDLGYVMTNGGPGYATTVLTIYIYNAAFQSQQFGYASTIGLVFMAIIMSITLIQWRFSNDGGRI